MGARRASPALLPHGRLCAPHSAQLCSAPLHATTHRRYGACLACREILELPFQFTISSQGDVKPASDFPSPPPLETLTPIQIRSLQLGVTHKVCSSPRQWLLQYPGARRYKEANEIVHRDAVHTPDAFYALRLGCPDASCFLFHRRQPPPPLAVAVALVGIWHICAARLGLHC